jgi:hypothetical protein
VANTLRPFGSPLLRHTEFANYQEQIARIRDRGWSVSGRMFGLVKGTVVITLTVRERSARSPAAGRCLARRYDCFWHIGDFQSNVILD